MNRKRFNKDFDEVGRKSRVKMHKSGKNWVRTVMSQLSLLRVIRGQGQAKITLPIIDKTERLDSSRVAYLQALLASGAVMAGTTLATDVFAEEQAVAVEKQIEGEVDTLVDKDVVIVETVTSEIVSEQLVSTTTVISEQQLVSDTSFQSLTTPSSLTNSELLSESASLSSSESASSSASVSASTSASTSASVSASTSTSVSESVSESHAASEVAKSSLVQSTDNVPSSASLTESRDTSTETTSSQTGEETGASGQAKSNLVASEDRGATYLGQVVQPAGLGQDLEQNNSAILAVATASSEVTTGLLATSLNSSSSSQSETAQMANSLDYTNLDNAIASLEQALSYPEVDAATTTATRYKRYETALKVAKAALEESLALREDRSASQDKIDTTALIAGQAAISLTGRINQIQAAGGMLKTVEGSGTRAVTQGAAATDVSTSGVLNFRRTSAEFRDGAQSTGSFNSYVKEVSYDYNASTNVMTYRVSITPAATGKVGIGISVDSTSTFGAATVTGGGTLESQSGDQELGGGSPKGRYFFISGVRAGTPLTFEVKVNTDGSGINNLRLKTANINNTNNSSFNGASQYWYINPSQRGIGTTTSVIANFNAGSTQTIYSRVADAPTITDNLTSTSTTVSGTGNPGSTVTLRFSNGATTTAVVQANGTWTATAPTGAMSASTTVSATQTTGKTNVIVENNRADEVLNDQTNLISAATVATIRDTTPPVVETQDLQIFENSVIGKVDSSGNLVPTPVRLARVSDNVAVTGVRLAANWGYATLDEFNQTNGHNIADDVLQDNIEVYYQDGYVWARSKNNQPLIRLMSNNQVGQNPDGGPGRHARRIYASDGTNVTTSAGMAVRVTRIPSGVINKNFGERVDQTEVDRIINGWRTGDFADAELTYTPLDPLPQVNETKIIRVKVTNKQGVEAIANIYVNYPPEVRIVVDNDTATSKTVYVFRDETVKLVDAGTFTANSEKLKVATAFDLPGVKTLQIVNNNDNNIENGKGLTLEMGPNKQTDSTKPQEADVYLTGKTTVANLAVGDYYNKIKAVDGYDNTSVSAKQLDIMIMDVQGGSVSTINNGTRLTVQKDSAGQSYIDLGSREVTSRFTDAEILAAVDYNYGTLNNAGKATLKAGAGLEKAIVLNSNHTVEVKRDSSGAVTYHTVTVRVKTSTNVYKDVQVRFKYVDTTAPTITEPRTIYVFKDTAMTKSLQLAKMSDVGTGINTTTSGTSNLQGLTLAKNSTDGNKNVTLMVSGTTSVNVGQYTQVLTANDQGQPMSTTNNQAVLQVISAANSTIQRADHTPITWSEIKAKVASTLGGNHAGAGLSYKLLVNGTPVNDANVTASQIPTVDGSVTVRLTTDYNGVDDAGVYKDVVVTLDYPEKVAPVVDITANNVFVFKDEAVKVANANFTQLEGAAGTRLQIGTATDQTGVGTVAIVDATSGAEANRGLTVSTDGANTSKTIYISGTPTAAKNLYTSKVKAVDTLGTSGTSQENLSLYVLEVPSEITLATREVTGTKFTNTEIAQAAINAVVAGNDSQKAAANLTAKVIANENHPQDLYRPNHTVTVRVMTASGTYKDVRVNVKYVDTTAPTITTNNVYVFGGTALQNPVDIVASTNDTGSGVDNNTIRLRDTGTGLTINSSGEVTGTFSPTGAGSYTRYVQVSDRSTDNNGGANTGEASFQVLSVTPQSATLTKSLTGNTKFTDDEIKQAVLNAMTANNFAAFGTMSTAYRNASGLLDISAYSIVGTPNHTFTAGQHTVTVRMTNAQGNYADVNVTINYTNAAPVISNETPLSAIKRSDSTPVTLDLSTAVTVTDAEDDSSTTDANNTTVTYKIKGPDGNVLKTVTALKGQPAPINVNELAAGTYTVEVEARDSAGATTTSNFQLTVKDNTPPVITSSDRTADRNDGTTIDISTGVSITDTEDTAGGVRPTVTYKVVDKTGKVVYEGTNPNVPSGTMLAGVYTVTITAVDSHGAKTEKSYQLTVTDKKSVSASASLSASVSASTSASQSASTST
ncbi:TPA: accessory Sec-dependent serine-rich glycoprotein adhesin, partial [Streptococcus suis]